ncbi:MAG: AraC family transcriptional regulator [Verrucomicrobia bacterium]|nr:AraC family transcriptional regulator [Verrucomicrobiota bacterium]
MTFRLHRPATPLQQFVDFFWYYDGFIPQHAMERVLPDGTFELIINLDATPRKLFERDNHQKFRSFRRAWLSGSHSRFIVIDTLLHSSMIGVHFRPGGIAPFLEMPTSAASNAVIELDAVWGAAASDLRDALLEQPNLEAKFRALEKFLLRRFQPVRVPGGTVRHALDQFLAAPHAVTIGRVCANLGISQKHFIALFRKEVGLTPKRFCRIRRFHEVLRRIEKQRAIDWADVACAGGYYDQAHFIHEFEAFSGINPTAYLRERGDYLNHVPIRR